MRSVAVDKYRRFGPAPARRRFIRSWHVERGARVCKSRTADRESRRSLLATAFDAHARVMKTTDVVQPTVLASDEVRALPAVPLGNEPGVTHQVVWRSGNSMGGVLTVEAGHRLGRHAHRTNHHHIWVVSGSALVLGDVLEPGSYVHIPAGVEHDIDATGTSGCTVFYLYLRTEPDATHTEGG